MSEHDNQPAWWVNFQHDRDGFHAMAAKRLLELSPRYGCAAVGVISPRAEKSFMDRVKGKTAIVRTEVTL